MEEEKSLSQENNMRSESESDQAERDDSEDSDEDQLLPEESEKSDELSEQDEDDEEIAKSSLVPKYGCLKGCLIPVLGVFIVIIAIGIIIHSKRDTIHDWLVIRIVSNTQKKVLTQPPDGIDKKVIELTFDSVKSAIKNGKIDEQEMETAIKDYLSATGDSASPELKKTEIDKLILRLNKAISDSG